MSETKPADPSNGPACDRCDDSLDGAHSIRLSASHRGPLADRYLDVDRRVCVDCLAAIGMLEFAVESDVDVEANKSELWTKLISVQSLRGDD